MRTKKRKNMKKIIFKIISVVFLYLRRLFGLKKKQANIQQIHQEEPIHPKMTRRQQRIDQYQQKIYDRGYTFMSFKSGLKKKITSLLVKFK